MTTESVAVLASRFNGSAQLFVSAVPALDLNRVRIHSVVGSGDGANEQLADVQLDKGVVVRNVEWVATAASAKRDKKKRKRSSVGGSGEKNSSNALRDDVAAVGTNRGDVLLVAPASGQGEISTVLQGGHSAPVEGIAADYTTGSIWTCDATGSICEWSAAGGASKRKVQLEDREVRVVRPVSTDEHPAALLLASTSVYLVSQSNPTEVVKTFPVFVNPVKDILVATASNPDLFVAYSASERSVNVCSLSAGKTVALLVLQEDAHNAALSQDGSVAAVVAESGKIELFHEPLNAAAAASSAGKANGSSRKSRKSGTTPSVTCNAVVSVTRPDGTPVKVENVAVAEDHLVVTWIEGGVMPVFEKVRWKDDDGKPITGDIVIKRARVSSVVAKSLESAKTTGVAYNEANSVVTSGRDVRALDVSDDEPEESTLAERLEALEVETGVGAGVSDAAAATTTSKRAANKTTNGKLELSAPGTFATILRQALKTNDTQLLETCLSQRDESLIKASVLRLDSSLAVALLERLAEKMARQPTRAGDLNFWIKWVMIAHGGYFVSLPNLLKTLSSLHATLADRVATLPRLLALQGRLELLNSQMELRRDILSSKRIEDDSDSEDESAVEYVEDGAYIANGEEDFDSDDYEDDDDEALDGPESGFIELEADESLDEDELADEDQEEDDDAMDEDDDDELNGE